MTGELSHIVDLLRNLRDDTTTLLREEVKLAKTEIGEKIPGISRNLAFLAAGALIGLTSLILILFALSSLVRQLFLSQGMSDGTATFLGHLIVGLIVAAISGALISKALKALKGESLAPRKTIETLKEDKVWAQRKLA